MRHAKEKYDLANLLLDLVDKVDRGEEISVPWITRQYDVKRAAAHRYIRFVRARRPALHFRTCNGERRWYLAAKKRRGLAPDDLVALELALESAKWLHGTPYSQLLEAEIQARHEEQDGTAADELNRFVGCFHHRTQGDISYDWKSDEIRRLLHAIRQRFPCRLRYQAHGQQEKSYDLHPALLILYKGHLYLRARKASDADAWRTLAVESIRDVRVDDTTTFKPPRRTETDPERVFKHSFGLYTECGRAEHVSIEVERQAATTFRRREFHPTQQVEELPSGRMRISWRIALCPELEGFLLSLAPHVRVVGPKKLAKKYAEYLAAAQALAPR